MTSTSILRSLILLTAAILFTSPAASGQGAVTLANLQWNITLTDFGYSDFLLDNTPGFEGRKYLSGAGVKLTTPGPAGGGRTQPERH